MPSEPVLTENNVPDQNGKVFIVTGATSGVGLELAHILYSKNAKVYLAVRSRAKAEDLKRSLEQKYPASEGSAIFLHLELDDLTTIKASAQQFLDQESRLDVLWNNAGVMIPPQGSKTKQGYELQLGTNCVGPFLFTKLLTSTLAKTAETAPDGSIRVVWVSSSAAKNFAPNAGVDVSNLDYHTDKGAWFKYGTSKAGNVLHAKEYARRHRESKIISLAVDPGNLKTDLYKHMSWWQKPIVNFILKPPVYGAYTELFAGLSDQVTIKDTGSFIVPWGKVSTTREDIEKAGRSRAEGGTGQSEDFWEWSERQVQSHI